MAHLLRGVCLTGVLAAIVLLSGSADAAKCYQFQSQNDYPNCKQLDANLVLYWRTLDNETLELVPDGDGYMNWIAIGISEAGMKGVDFNVVYLPTQGSAWLIGDYLTARNYSEEPTYDEEQNAVLADMPVFDKDNHTMPYIQRPLDSCDAEDIPIYLDVERSLIWAYDWKIVWDQAKNNLDVYTKGILKGLKLFSSSDIKTSNNASSSPLPMIAPTTTTNTTSFTMPNYPVPTDASSTACVNLALPNATQYHVVQYQGFNTTPLVVRIAGYVCAAGVVPSQPFGVPYSCNNGTLLLPALPGSLPVGCETLNFIWTPGGGAFQAPLEAGFLIGAGAATTMVLQVSYWNLEGTVGQVDSSGFRFTYTSELRNASLGVLTVGNTDMRIPANNDSFTALPNICAAECTGKRILQPVTLVSNFFVMGSLGTAMLTRHIRNGSAIMPVGRINYWDKTYPTFQTVFPGSETLQPNDSLISLCSYNSTGVKAQTFFGYQNGSELCFNYITFYPTTAMPDLDYCVARTRDNVSACSTRTRLTQYAKKATSDEYWNGTRIQVGPMSVAYYKSQQCQLHDAGDNTPQRKPKTKAAVASIILVPIVLLLVGAILWSKYSKQEEMERLLEEARVGALAPFAAD